MNWQPIALAQVTPQPWKNGGGITRQLLAWPGEGAHWQWRISVAQIDVDGPFSAFDGIQRWFAVLDGQGVQLMRGAGAARDIQTLQRHSDPFQFDGALALDCHLLDGPTQDLNLMVRKEFGASRMLRVRGLWQGAPDQMQPGQVCALWAGAGGAQLQAAGQKIAVAPQSLVWTVVERPVALAVESDDAIWMEVQPCKSM